MKKFFIAVLMLAGVGSLCMAQPMAQPTPPPLEKTHDKVAETKYFEGKVKSVSFADAAKGIKSEVIVLDDKKTEMKFLIRSTTALHDENARRIPLNKIRKNALVTVKYIATQEGVNETLSVQIMKK